MMRWKRYVRCNLCVGLGVLLLGAFPVHAAEYVLGPDCFPGEDKEAPLAEVVVNVDGVPVEGLEDEEGSDDWDDWELASPGDATPSDADREAPEVSEYVSGPVSVGVTVEPRGSYNSVYEGSYSTSQLSYFSGIVERLAPDKDYVLFRQSRYQYRLVYAEDLEVDGSTFRSSSADYVLYDTEDGVVSSGHEGSFTLRAGSYPVYTSLESMYPVLVEGVRNYEFKTLLFMSALGMLVSLFHSFFFVGRRKL